jgi:hypothetical protein
MTMRFGAGVVGVCAFGVALACGSRTALEGAGPTETGTGAPDASDAAAPVDAGGDAAESIKCVSGAPPQQVVEGVTANWVAVDDSWAYFGRDPTVMRVSTRNGAVGTVATLLDANFVEGALDTDALYLVDGSARIIRAPLSGAPIDVLATAPIDLFPNGIAFDSDTVFVAYSQSIYSVPKAGGPFTQLSLPTWMGWTALLWAADDANVYYSKTGYFEAFDPKAATQHTLPVSPFPPNAVVKDASGFYATAGLDVYALPNGARANVPLATLLANPGSLATDESAVYWIDGGVLHAAVDGGRVMKVAKTGGAVTQLATVASNVTDLQSPAIAVDDQCVYWVDGAVMMRVAK